MFIYTICITLVSLFYGISLTGCGESEDLLLSSGGTYRINASINGYSLNECSILRQNDMITPYFEHSVSGDPDIKGLTVFFQGPSGRLAGKKTRYLINPLEKSPPQAPESPGSPGSEPPLPADPQGAPPSPEASASPLPPKPQETEDRIIPVERFDKPLPPFPLAEPLEIGEYALVFQVMGERETLDTFEQPVFFLGNAHLALDDLQRYLPGTASHDYFLSPGSNILLEAQIAADSWLDPYIIWYNGEKRIQEGALFDGKDRFIWKVPEQSGFLTIRAMVFPFKPRQSALKGMVKELSLPVSSKSKLGAYFLHESSRFAYWYQFQSSLLDAKSPGESGRSLRPATGKPPRWLPCEGTGMYGLAIGPDDRFLLPDNAFLLPLGEEGVREILFRLVPLGEGLLWKGVFKTGDKTQPDSEGLTMTVSLLQGQISLSLSRGTLSSAETLESETIKTGTPITLTIHFEMKGVFFTASVYLEGVPMEMKPLTMGLPEPLTGKGAFQLGGASDTGAETALILTEMGIVFTQASLESALDQKGI